MANNDDHTVTVDPEYGTWTFHCPYDGQDAEQECYTPSGCKYVEWFDNSEDCIRGNKQTWRVFPIWNQGDFYTFELAEYLGVKLL